MPSASATKVLARGFTISINTGTEGVPIWTPIKGLTSFGFGFDKNDADTTDFNSAGWAEHLPASLSFELSLEGYTLEDTGGDKARDTGQAAVETLADAMGTSGIKQFRITTPGGTTKTFKASAQVDPFGGGNDDPSAWAATLTGTSTIATA